MLIMMMVMSMGLMMVMKTIGFTMKGLQGWWPWWWWSEGDEDGADNVDDDDDDINEEEEEKDEHIRNERATRIKLGLKIEWY